MLELGGLFILGTERHESRRIDNQLRGRSGRQGDPGESRFYLSAEDDLIRLFAGDRIYKILDRLGPVDEEGEEYPLEAKMLTRTVENAQKKVEEQNFLIRKRVLEYDDVLNEQRRIVYRYRREILEGRDMSDVAQEELGGVIERIVAEYTPGEVYEDWDLAELQVRLEQLWPLGINLPERRPRAGVGPRGARRDPRGGLDPRLRGARGGVRRRAACATSSARSCSRSSTTAGASTSSRWTTCARGSTFAASPRSTRSSPTRTRATRCSPS